MSEIFSQHLWQWLILLAVLGFAIYALFIIKNEKQTFIDESSPLSLGEVSLDIPNWWTLTREEENSYYYERTDTRYEWFSKLDFVTANEFEKIEDIFDRYILKQSVQFDPDVTITTNPRHLFFAEGTADKIIECLRVEGMGTQHGNKRIYWDVYLFRLNDSSDYYIFESWSSVLNGMLEGPFFEESVSRMRITST